MILNICWYFCCISHNFSASELLGSFLVLHLQLLNIVNPQMALKPLKFALNRSTQRWLIIDLYCLWLHMGRVSAQHTCLRRSLERIMEYLVHGRNSARIIVNGIFMCVITGKKASKNPVMSRMFLLSNDQQFYYNFTIIHNNPTWKSKVTTIERLKKK